jgi:hypothetical protein
MEAHRQEKDQKNVKRVDLPSGKTIEVVYFQETLAPEPQPGTGPRELHVCPSCDSSLAYPVHWSEADQTRWEVTLRCPNCEWSETDVFDQETVERFDEELDRGTDQLVDDLKRLVYANMEEQIDRFCEALANDNILPEDF